MGEGHSIRNVKHMKQRRKIRIAGLDTQELLQWSQSSAFQGIIFTGEPVIFSVGTSEILGVFSRSKDWIKVVLSHIEGGGEGVLLVLMNAIRNFAKTEAITEIRWVVHAVDCPKPNPKLPRILELKGFHIIDDPIDGKVYQKREMIELH